MTINTHMIVCDFFEGPEHGVLAFIREDHFNSILIFLKKIQKDDFCGVQLGIAIIFAVDIKQEHIMLLDTCILTFPRFVAFLSSPSSLAWITYLFISVIFVESKFFEDELVLVLFIISHKNVIINAIIILPVLYLVCARIILVTWQLEDRDAVWTDSYGSCWQWKGN